MPEIDLGASTVVVGSGPAALAVSHTLMKNKMPVVVLDAAQDSKIPLGQLRLSHRTQAATLSPQTYEFGQPPPKKTLFGDAFAHETPRNIEVQIGSELGANPSFAFGGFSNIWGANLMRLRGVDTTDWPSAIRDLEAWYVRALNLLPLSSSCIERVTLNSLPRFSISEVPSDKRLVEQLCQNSVRGVSAEPSLLAVRGVGQVGGCTGCGQCLSGCSEDAIFSTRDLFSSLVNQGLRLMRNFTVLGIEEIQDSCFLYALDPLGVLTRIRVSRVVLATGPLITTALVAGALGLKTKELLDNQAFTGPILTMRRSDLAKYTLNQLNICVASKLSNHTEAHVQLYGTSRESALAIREWCNQRAIPEAISRLTSRHILVMHGFMTPKASGRVRVYGLNPRTNIIPKLKFECSTSSQLSEIKKTLTRLSHFFVRNKMYLPTSFTRVELVGQSYHLSASFPMCENPKLGQAYLDGRPVGLRNVFVADASVLPPMPPQSPTLTVMANAIRIAEQLSYHHS